jgi:hypothetical protein
MAKQSENKATVNRIITDGINYCYWDLSDSDRALMMIHVRTASAEAVEEISQAIEDGLPEVLVRLQFVQMIMAFRAAEEYGIDVPNTFDL